MVETEGIIKTKPIMVLEAIEIGIEITRIIDPITEGKILTKVMAKDLDTEAQVENAKDLDPGTSRENLVNRYKSNQSRNRER